MQYTEKINLISKTYISTIIYYLIMCICQYDILNSMIGFCWVISYYLLVITIACQKLCVLPNEIQLFSYKILLWYLLYFIFYFSSKHYGRYNMILLFICIYNVYQVYIIQNVFNYVRVYKLYLIQANLKGLNRISVLYTSY